MPETSTNANKHKLGQSQANFIHKGEVLLPVARREIAGALGRQISPTDETQPWLHEKAASFVTLTMHQHLRGCIGSLEAYRPLLMDVKANAYAAAFRDPRFSPLSIAELDATEIEISLLSPQQAMSFIGEQDALAQMKPQVDGIVFEYGQYRSTFLPQVWEQLPNAETFMAHLKHKAGLPTRFWHDDVRIYRYTVSKFKEKDLKQESVLENTKAAS